MKNTSTKNQIINKSSLLKKLFLALNIFSMLILFNANAFGQTAIYTVSTVSAVTTTGTAPGGSSATYTQNYATAKQLTATKSAVLTLSGYAGYRITSIVLNMHSNASAGAGSMTVVAGATSIFNIPAATLFSNASWNGAYTSAYVDLTKTPTAYDIATGESVVFTILASTNSLFINSYSITYTPIASTPTISGISPTSGCVGSSVVITGTNFTGASAVTIGGTAVTSYTVNSATQITAVVASGTTGTIAVTTAGGTATSAGTFTINPLPTISGTLSVAVAGTTTLTGSATAHVTTPWASATPAVATITSGGVVTGVSAGSSVITYMNTNGCTITATVNVSAGAPTISGISPTSGCVGSSVVITGTNFTGASAVTIGGTAVTSYTINSATQITAVVATGTTGTIAVTTAGGTATSAGTFTINPLPTISGTLSVAVAGTTTLTGSATAHATTPWSSATPAVATITSGGVVTGVSAGSSVITYMNTNGCTQTATVTVTGGACTPPTTQASAFASSAITSSGMTVSWTRGNGNAVIVVIKATSAVDTDPTNGTTYTANASYGSGTEIGTGNYVVYSGTGTSVAVTGLVGSATFHYAVYEYNSTGMCYNATQLTGNATTTAPASTKGTILFDATKAETAGNADWVIDADTYTTRYYNTGAVSTGGSEATAQRYPTPAQSGITGATLETYWVGGLSSFGIAMVKQGYPVETLPWSGRITYGDATNPQDLSNYAVFVMCEPNIMMTAAEKTAVLNYVNAGGGLYMLSDHGDPLPSDRNNDGNSSLNVLNDLMTGNPFGMTFDNVNFSQNSTNIINTAGDPLVFGPAGTVGEHECHGSTTMTLSTAANPTVKGVVAKTGASLSGSVNWNVAYATYGAGRVVGMGDSSPAEDITSDPADVTYDGWTQPTTGANIGDNGTLITNATIWLAGTAPVIMASPTTLTGNNYTFGFGPSTPKSFVVSAGNLSGTGNITITGSTNYEVCLTVGGVYAASVTLPYASGIITGQAKTVFVRLKSGLALGNYNSEIIAISGGGATTVNITCSGSVTSTTPTLAVTPASQTGYTYVSGSGPSVAKTYSLSGSILNGTQVTVAGSTNFEVSLDGTTFSASVNVPYTAPTLSSTTIYVRLVAGLAVGTYATENVSFTDNGGTPAAVVNVANSGTVTAIGAGSLFISEFAGYGSGATPSNNEYIELTNTSGASINLAGWTLEYYNATVLEKTWTLTGTILNNDAYVVALRSANSLTPDLYAAADASMNSTGYVVLKQGTTIMDEAGSSATKFADGANYEFTDCTNDNKPVANWVNNGTGAGTPGVVNCVVTGPVITISSNTTVFGNQCVGVSYAEQTYNVSGTNLGTNNIVVTPPANFQISTTSGSGYASTPITLTPTSGTVALTPIYVIFVPVAVTAYSGNITHTCTGATQKDNALSGAGVNSVPTVTTPSSASIATTTVTLGATITDEGCTNVTEEGIYYSTTAGFADGAGTKVSVTAGAPYPADIYTIPVTGLTANTVYYYKGFATNTPGSGYSTQGTFTTIHNAPNVGAGSGATSSSIVANWTAPTAAGAASFTYTIEVSTLADFSVIAYTQSAISSATLSATATGLTANTTYYFRVTAVNAGGSSAWSANSVGYATTAGLSSSVATLSGFTYVEGSGPSANQTFTISGTALIGSGNITVAGTTNYEVSTDGTTFAASVTYAYTAGVITGQPSIVYVRLKSGLTNATSPYNGQTISISGGGATAINVTCNGTVTSPTPTITVTGSLVSFGSQCINTASAEQSYTVSGSSLTANISIVPPTHYEISTGTGGAFVATNPITLTQTAGTVPLTTIYVRFKPTLTGAKTGNIAHTSTGATTQNLATVSSTGVTVPAATATTAVTAITTTTASSGGNFVAASITASGVCWNTVTAPTLSNSFTTDGAVSGAYASSITGLTPGTTYFVRSYATNSCGTTYGTTERTFTTLKAEPTNYPSSFSCGTPTATTLPLTWADAASGVIPDGYLIKWSSTSYAAIIDPVDGTAEANGAGVQNVTQGTQTYTPTGLTSNTTYYFKIWSYTNSGTGIDYKLVTEPQTSCMTDATSACGTEGFNSFDAGTRAPGWTFTTFTNATVYTSAGNFGALSPSIKFDATGDVVETAPVISPTQLSFWIKGQAPSTSTFLVEGFNGAWTTIQNITTIPTVATTFTYNSTSTPALASGFTKFRFTFTRVAGAVSFDDVAVTCNYGPTLSVSPSTLSGLTYSLSAGPSSQLSFNLSGSNLDGSAVTVTPPTNYEISTTSGSGFVSTPITLPAFSGASTPIYVRLKAGLPQAAYNLETITCAGGGAAVSKTVTCSGDVTAAAAEMDVLGNSISIVDGDATPSTTDWTDFGGTDITATTIDKVFTINNIGLGTLNLTGTPKVVVGGTNAADFTVIVDPTTPLVASTGTTTFTVRFDPSVLGTRSATLSIANDDSNENPYNFSIQGTGNSTEIQLQGGSTPTTIADGDVTPSTTDWTDFGSTPTGGTPITKVFTINNIGTSVLNLNGTPKVAISGTNAADFIVSVQPAATVAVGGSTTFTVVFTPSADLARNATVTIANDDLNENPYNFSITGYGTPFPATTLADNGTQVAIASAFQGINNHVLHRFSLATTMADATVTGISVSTDGTYLTTDITNLKVWYSTDNTLSTGTDALLSTFTNPGVAGVKVFPTFTSQGIVSGTTGYFFITCDIAAGATINNTINVSTVEITNITYSGTTTQSGSTTAGGVQTFAAPPQIFISEFASYGYSKGGGTVIASKNEYVELTNLGSTTIDLTGWYLEYYAGGLREGGVQDLTGTLAPNSAYVIAARQNSTTLEPDFVTLSTTWAMNSTGTANLYYNGTLWDQAGDHSIFDDFANDQNYEFLNCGGDNLPVANWTKTPSTGTGDGTPGAVNCAVCVKPTTQASAMTITNATLTSVDVQFTRGNGERVIVLATTGVDRMPDDGKTYTASTVFGSGSKIGASCYVVYDGVYTSGTAITVTNLVAPTTYKFYAFEYNNASKCYLKTIGIAGTNMQTGAPVCSTPTVHGNTMVFSNVTDASMTVTFTPGNGLHRIVVAKTSPFTTAVPATTVSAGATNALSDGTAFDGGFVVYKGDFATFDITGLTGGTTYYFKVFEYNCTLVYSAGTPLEANQTTDMTIITNLSITCKTLTTATISWTYPAGFTSTGVAIGIRSGTTAPSNLTGDANSWTANTAYLGGTNFDGGTSSVVFKGSVTTSVTVTGLTPGTNYSIKAYTFQNNTGTNWAVTKPTTSISNLALYDVTQFRAIAANATAELKWTMPSCYDEIMVVAKPTASTSVAPSGNGSAYTASATYGLGTAYDGGFVVYKGTGTSQIITGLTNGTNYCFKAFVRIGSEWSAGVVDCETPRIATTLEQGDLVIISVNTYAAGMGDDEICFITFKDITETTRIDFTDQGYGAFNAGFFGDYEGVIGITRIGGGSIEAGVPVCFTGHGDGQAGTSEDFTVSVCGVTNAAHWTISKLTTVSSDNSYDLNKEDQIWIMQGGTWDCAGVKMGDDSYSGNVLYGWTATGWRTAPGVGFAGTNNTWGSMLYPGTECFNTDVTVEGTQADKVKYIGPMTSATQSDWVTRVNDDANWISYAHSNTTDNVAWNADVHNRKYGQVCIPFEIIKGEINTTYAPGYWVGGTSNDWFDCMNWGNLRLPNEAVDVTIPNDCSNPAVIDDGNAFNSEAKCKNITITAVGARYLRLNHTLSVLNVHGDFTNNGTFTHSLGVVKFKGTTEQTISGSNAITFYNFLMLNTAATGGATLSGLDITVSKCLSLSDGIITTGANKVIMSNSQLDGLNGILGGSNASFINGNLRQYIASNLTVYPLHVGNSNTTTGYHRADLVNASLTGTTYLDASVAAITETGNDIDANLPVTLMEGTLNLTDILPSSIWTLTPDIQPTGGSYGVRLFVENVTGLSASDDNKFFPVKRPDASTTYADWTKASATVPTTGLAGRIFNSGAGYGQRLGYTTFSKHALVKGGVVTPIELLYFDAVRDGKIVNVNWATASEKNNDYFTVERSKDANNFDFVSNYSGAGNSLIPLNYNIIDFTPYSEKSYYRLTQTDFDGTNSFSKIVSVEALNENISNNISIVKVQNAIQIEIENATNSTYYVEVVDMLGRVLYKDKFNSISNKLMIDIDNKYYSKGIYNVAVFNENSIKTNKIVIE